MKLQVKRKGARIELIALIDIIFLLLVFFIYSMLSMVVYRGIPVVLPAAETIEAEKGQMVNITIDETGYVFVDKEWTPIRDLLSRLKRERQAFPDKAAVISGHRESPYRAFVDVLDKVRLAGFQAVSMEARPRERGE
ncbi:MAG: biopolymer transporter ExbD [Thermodesulfobacteriota bacterium]|nr:biopolymer transporter ExbD [Thermodesulfobacteriota bacterium]